MTKQRWAQKINIMSKYFSLSEAALRYSLYRPKVHGIILDWLKKHVDTRSFNNAIDIACGTGDSMLPLSHVSNYTLGIDGSNEMLKYARKRGLNVENFQYDQVKTNLKFDLLTTCMAFHWFDTNKAISEFKRISSDTSIWLIYNFTFNGHQSNNEFNNWFFRKYLSKYPSPQHGKYSSVIPLNTININKLGYGNGSIDLDFELNQLVGYLTTQSNIEHAVQNGKSYDQIESELYSDLRSIKTSPNYIYGYTYELYQYDSGQQVDKQK